MSYNQRKGNPRSCVPVSVPFAVDHLLQQQLLLTLAEYLQVHICADAKAKRFSEHPTPSKAVFHVAPGPLCASAMSRYNKLNECELSSVTP